MEVYPWGGAAPFVVKRSYAEFRTLARELRKGGVSKLATLPRRRFRAVRGARLDSRRVGLEVYLAVTVRQPMSPSALECLRLFLGFAAHVGEEKKDQSVAGQTRHADDTISKGAEKPLAQGSAPAGGAECGYCKTCEMMEKELRKLQFELTASHEENNRIRSELQAEITRLQAALHESESRYNDSCLETDRCFAAVRDRLASQRVRSTSVSARRQENPTPRTPRVSCSSSLAGSSSVPALPMDENETSSRRMTRRTSLPYLRSPRQNNPMLAPLLASASVSIASSSDSLNGSVNASPPMVPRLALDALPMSETFSDDDISARMSTAPARRR
eukprot:TRINITY_DN15049_c0_g1_i1.p1 TRINITY_DN15049_c0_g1~~TRINITY_DN15049_c0_g1_i1.p1  ORF type:complete len:387 (+),score=67.27 TRINITY_DN15049_c0_g1_i1:171-1163(+)